ncbi:MAG: tripartite tricarboxylate transporter substrate binding protein [Oscillospiraceae bacterium]|jgi:tripartite-type tricarboxylate transporter receptor subunit TctC|nr:tripartite tricarboxylate transporter substrate binding protein [Oscillospiraceae bacterium]
MKSRIFKHASLFLCAAILASCIGCSSGSQNSGSSAPATNNSTNVSSETNWPQKKLQIVVPFSAGGDTDFHARLYAKYLSNILGQNVIVTNVNGSNGATGSTQVKDASPNGYTALFFHDSMLMNKVVGVTDFDHTAFDICCGGVVDTSYILAVNASSPYKTLDDLVQAAKKDPGKITYASSVGGYTYYVGCLLEKLTGISLNKVDAGGGSERNAALLAKKIDTNVNPYGVMKPYIDSGDFRVLCVFSDKRSDLYPDVPTAKEQGYDLAAQRVYFLAFPKGTDSAIIEKMNNAMKQVSEMPEYKKAIEKSYCLSPKFKDTQDTKSYFDKTIDQFMSDKSLIMGE